MRLRELLVGFLKLALLEQSQAILENELRLLQRFLVGAGGQIIFLDCRESRVAKRHLPEREVEEGHPLSELY